jgi:hypothetical protein
MPTINHMWRLQNEFVDLWPKVASLRSEYARVSSQSLQQLRERLVNLTVTIPYGEHGSFSPAHNVRSRGDVTNFELIDGCKDCIEIRGRYDLTELILQRNELLGQIRQATEISARLEPKDARLFTIAARLSFLAAKLRLPSYVAPSAGDGSIALIEVKAAKNVRFHNTVIAEEGRAVIYFVRGKSVGAIFDDKEKLIAVDRGDGIWRLPAGVVYLD